MTNLTNSEQIFEVYASLVSYVDDWYKPKSDAAQTNLIKNGLSIFNQKLFDEVTYDPLLDQTSRDLSIQEIQILAKIMAYITLNNVALEFASTFGSSSSAISIRSYKAQYDSKSSEANRMMYEIDKLVFSISDYGDDEEGES